MHMSETITERLAAIRTGKISALKAAIAALRALDTAARELSKFSTEGQSLEPFVCTVPASPITGVAGWFSNMPVHRSALQTLARVVLAETPSDPAIAEATAVLEQQLSELQSETWEPRD
jgi:hypothetical protein